MFEFLKRFGAGRKPEDPVAIVDEALAIESDEEIGQAAELLEEHTAVVQDEVARRIAADRLRGPARHAATIWLAHHATGNECQPFLDAHLIDATDGPKVRVRDAARRALANMVVC